MLENHFVVHIVVSLQFCIHIAKIYTLQLDLVKARSIILQLAGIQILFLCSVLACKPIDVAIVQDFMLHAFHSRNSTVKVNDYVGWNRIVRLGVTCPGRCHFSSQNYCSLHLSMHTLYILLSEIWLGDYHKSS